MIILCLSDLHLRPKEVSALLDNQRESPFLKTIKTARHSRYNLPAWRMKKLEDFIRARATDLLGSNKE